MHTTLRRLLRPALLATALTLAPPASAIDVAGVHFDDKTSLGGTELVLNGAALRTRFMLKIYAIGLYLPRSSNTADAVSASGGPKRIQITTLRDLGASEFADALVDGLKRNHSEAELARLQPRVDEFRNAIIALKSTPAGSQIRLEWLPGSGTRLSVGNEARGKDIPGEDFYRALLRIWIGEKPVDADLKNALLGKA